MNPIKSKKRKLNIEVRPAIGVNGAVVESDLEAHSSDLSEEDMAEVAAYGATRSCYQFQ